MQQKVETPEVEAWRSILFCQAEVIRAVESAFERAGLVPLTWYDVLLNLRYSKGMQARFRELPGQIVLSPSALSRCLDRMEQAGLIERRECNEDARGMIVAITEAGEQALRKAWPTYRKCIRDVFGNRLQPTDAKAIVEILAPFRGKAGASIA